MKYSLVNYFDVLGNSEDGYEVNNLCIEKTGLELPEDDAGIINLLVDIGFIKPEFNSPEYFSIWNDYEMIEISDTEGMPICRLEMEYSE